jgi:hypothetical protein
MSSASQQAPCLLWNQKVHYHVHSSPALVTILKQLNLVHPLPFCLFNKHFNTGFFLPSTPQSSKFSVRYLCHCCITFGSKSSGRGQNALSVLEAYRIPHLYAVTKWQYCHDKPSLPHCGHTGWNFMHYKI